MSSELETRASLATHTRVGWECFVSEYPNIIDLPDVSLNYGTRKTPVNGLPPTVDSHGLKDGVPYTFLSEAGLVLPYYCGSDADDPDSALRRAARTRVGAVNNRLKTRGEVVRDQTDGYKARRDRLVGSLFGCAFALVQGPDEPVEYSDVAEVLADLDIDPTEALRSFLRGDRELTPRQLKITYGRLAVANASNIKTALNEIKARQ